MDNFMENIPIFNFKIREDGTSTGMIGISIVDEPAIQSSFEKFNEVNNQVKYIALKDEKGNYKKELLGAALRPDIPILRKDENNDYYYGIFEKETIEIIRNKFHKQKLTDQVNLQHDENKKIDAYLIESYIISNQEQLNAVKSMGLENVEVGAWIVRYKIENDQVFNEALEGKYTGFSIEILLDRELAELSKNNYINKNNNKVMSKFNELINKFKTVLNEFENLEEEKPVNEPVNENEEKFETAVIDDTGQTVEWSEVGEAVYYIDEEGNRGEVVADGEYPLDNNAIMVIVDGVLSELKNVEPTEEEQSKEEEVVESTENLEEQKENVSDLSKSLSELIPLDKEGTYQLEVYVSGGKVQLGTLYAWTYQDLKLKDLTEKYESLMVEKKDLTEKLEKLPANKPVFTSFTNTNEKSEPKKRNDFKSNLDYQLYRLGLDN